MLIIHSTEIIIKSILDTHILKAYTDNKIDLRIYATKMVSFCDFIGLEEENSTGNSECKKNKNNKKKQKLDYNLVIYMMHSLSKQQQILEKIGYSFYTFRLKDIIVIDDKYFFCIGPELIMPINKNKVLIFYKPPKTDIHSFYSPELLAMNSIPFKISVKTIYYSFGALAIYCLGNPSTYEHTKLYWFIKRCIIEEELRQLLFI
jgi:hypothetical protein